jgi:hypothetical protein
MNVWSHHQCPSGHASDAYVQLLARRKVSLNAVLASHWAAGQLHVDEYQP